jgi:hypothetical protein
MMDYIYLAAIFAGGGWTGYLLGQFVNLKNTNIRLNVQQREIEHLSDLVATFQRKQPERTADGKFASKRERVTAELAAYVAERKAA